ncbi:MAG: valine--tRNA ligase [Candidatus Brocadiae bacterium]|nr:valine--tRNA ligase [Candidatus Brocadiia bacterium]
MSSTYSPKDIEGKWYEHWEKNKQFQSVPDQRPPYTIVIPPPNITGALHLGHALNNTIQDVLIRYHRMNGYNACWIPGTDHAGIATQSVVEKRLYKEEQKTRHDIGREALLKKIWQWKETYGNRIIDQLKKLGCSCDWDRTCFTMSEGLSNAVRFVFLELFKEGLVYRGKRLINWCPGCRTALSDDELNYKDVPSYMWQIKYPIENSQEFIIVATTRPETMLGDTAVAVNSQDPRYQNLIGKNCILPLMGRKIPIVADDILADPQKGTGAVKVTPGHDPNDYACGMRNRLPMINILKEDGSLNENAGAYQGMTVEKARAKVLEDLQNLGLLGKKEEIVHPVAHCYRSEDIVEPYLSDQWFVKMAPLVEMAKQAAASGEVTFFPARRTDDYMHWLNNTPDWCISRQIWWGHRIPIWYCVSCYPEIQVNEKGEPRSIPGNAFPILPEDQNHDPVKCPKCSGKNLVQDPDVLDTWFSSQLWPLSTLGWPEKTKDLAYYYPTNVLVTARDIIALWVARMVMMGMKFMDKKPFSHVFIHGTIQDEHGDIMSKSRGNGFDPVKIIDGGSDQIDAAKALKDAPAKRMEHYPAYGCDALRFGLMSMASGQGQDIRILVQRKPRGKKEQANPEYDVEIPLFEEGKRFCNKIWQASHGVIFRNCENLELTEEIGSFLEDKWLSDKMHHLIEDCKQAMVNYRIGEMCNMLYHFFWDDLCSWYLEVAKPRLWGEQGEESKRCAQSLLVRSLSAFLRMLHPIMPFVTEDLWQTLQSLLPEKYRSQEACILSQWPKLEEYPLYGKTVEIVELSREIVSAVNNIRAEQKLKPGDKIPQAIFTGNDPQVLKDMEVTFAGISKLTKIEKIESQVNLDKPKQAAVRIVKNVVVYIPLEGLIDFEKEKEKLAKEMEKLQKLIVQLEQKLANSDYTSKAPSQVIQKDRERLEEWKQKYSQWEEEKKGL